MQEVRLFSQGKDNRRALEKPDLHRATLFLIFFLHQLFQKPMYGTPHSSFRINDVSNRFE
jgi:hypothetical protein